MIKKDENKVEKYKENYKKHYNIKVRDKSEFKAGDTIFTRENKIWIPDVVLEKIKNYPRYYIVKKQNGQKLRRSPWHLRKSGTQAYNYNYIVIDNDDIVVEEENFGCGLTSNKQRYDKSRKK